MFPVISLALAVNETIQYYDTGAPTTDQNNGSSATAVKPVIDGWLVAAGCVIVVAIIAQYIRYKRAKGEMFQPKVSLPASKAEIHRSKTLFVMVESRNPSTNQMMLPTAGGNDEIPADIATEAVSSDASMPYPHRRPVMTAKLNANDVQLADLDDHESADLSLQQLPSSRVLSDCTASVDKKNSNINDTSRGGSRLQAFLTTGRGESAVMNDLESESDGDDERD